MRRVILIRDDDLNYFTDIENIYFYYKKFIDNKIPFCLAAIALVKPSSDNIISRVNSKGLYNINKNKKLVAFINKHDNINIMQHGCTHESNGNIREYEAKKNLLKKTKLANKILTNSFKRKITTFIAPHDAFSNHAIEVMQALSMNILRGRFNKNFFFKKKYLKTLIKNYHHALVNSVKLKKLSSSLKVLNYGNLLECPSMRITVENNDMIFKTIDHIKNHGGEFVLTNHVHKYSHERKEILIEILKYASNKKIEIVNDKTLFNVN